MFAWAQMSTTVNMVIQLLGSWKDKDDGDEQQTTEKMQRGRIMMIKRWNNKKKRYICRVKTEGK